MVFETNYKRSSVYMNTSELNPSVWKPTLHVGARVW